MDRGSARRRLRPAAATVIDVGRSIVREWREDRVSGLAAEVAFFGILSLFPVLLAVAAALGSLEAIAGHEVAERAQAEVLGFLRATLTDDAAGTVDAVEDIFAGSSPGVLTVGVAAAVWSASRGFTALIRALDVVYDLDERRGYFPMRVLALALALGSVGVVALMLATLVPARCSAPAPTSLTRSAPAGCSPPGGTGRDGPPRPSFSSPGRRPCSMSRRTITRPGDGTCRGPC